MFRNILKIALVVQALLFTGPATLVLVLGAMFVILVCIGVPFFYILSLLTGTPSAEEYPLQYGLMAGKLFFPWIFGVLAIGNLWHLLSITLTGKKLTYTKFFIISVIGGTAIAAYGIFSAQVDSKSIIFFALPSFFGYQLLLIQYKGWYRYFSG